MCQRLKRIPYCILDVSVCNVEHAHGHICIPIVNAQCCIVCMRLHVPAAKVATVRVRKETAGLARAHRQERRWLKCQGPNMYIFIYVCGWISFQKGKKENKEFYN